MNRPFFLFAGGYGKADKGWNSFKGQFATREEALEEFAKLKVSVAWAQIVNVNSQQIVWDY